MADNYLLGPDDPDANNAVGTAADFGKTLGVGAAAVGSNLAAGARYFYEQGKSENGAAIAKSIQDIFNAGGESIGDTINPETKKLAASTLTSDEFWSHPVLGAALKTTGMVPAVAALAIPGGLLADAVGATLVAAAGGGAINAGAGLDEFYKKLDGMSDEELQTQSPKYKAMREMMDERDARVRFNKEAQGWGPAINAVIGAAAGVVGPAGVAARGIAGGTKGAVLGATEEGALKSAGIAAGEGAAGNAIQAGVADVVSQNTGINADMQKEFDKARTANAALEGGALGGFMGGAVGLVMGGHKAPTTVDKVTKALNAADDVTPPKATTDVAGPQPQTGKASAQPAKPADTPDIGNPQNAPTRSERDLGKRDDKTAAPKKEPAPAPVPVDPAIAQAVASNEGTTVAAHPTEVAAMTERSPNATLDKLDQEGKPPAAPVPAEVTPPATPTLDTGVNVPEAAASLPEQIAQIGTGDRKAVMAPKGTLVPAAALAGRTDLKRLKLGRGTFIYDPKLTSPAEITKLSKLGRENELLGLGPVSKPEAVADVQAGATPLAVTERTPDGVEVKAAAGSTDTLPEQRAALEATKTPGNVVAVETPENVLQMRTAEQPKRNAGGGRILENLSRTADTVPLSDFNANRVEPPKEVAGKRYSEKERAALDEKLAKAKAITDRHAPGEAEANYLKDPEARDAVIRRAQSMVADADKEGVKVQAQLKKSTKGDAASDHASMQILRAAKDLAKVAAKRKAGREITEATGRFAEAERLIRGGHSDEVLAQRREEGDVAMRRGSKADDVSASADVTPESELAAKEGAAVASKEDVTAEAAAGKADTEKDAVKTAVPKSAKGEIRGVGDGTETIDGVTRAKAASGEKLSAEAKAKMIAEMNAKLQPAKVKNDALHVDRNPTEAQKIAGNYKKGHRSVEGLDFTIENPKGAVRRGRDGEHAWEVRMPADYGYIRRTKGADGDHVDAYDGKSGDRFFVVDQLDHKTGTFDEHKVMMRFKDEAAAVDAYKKAFSDGKGEARLGNIHEVSAAELKDWLRDGDTTEPHTTHALERDMDRVNFDVPERPSPEPMNGPEALARIDFRDAGVITSPIARFMQGKLAELTKHVQVFMVSPKEMEAMGHKGALGLHSRTGDISSVYVSTDAQKFGMGMDYGQYGHTLIHELAHAVTVREIENVAGFRAGIIKLARTAHDYINSPQMHAELQREFGNTLGYAFSKNDTKFVAKEFIAEALSNPRFQEVLARIPLDHATAEYFGLHQKTATMWDGVRAAVKKAIQRITGHIPKFDSVLDGVLKVSEHLTHVHETEYLRPLMAGEESRPQKAVEGEALRMVDDAKSAVKEWLEKPANEHSPKALALRTFDNIAQIADHYFGESNPVRKIHEAVERIRVTGEKIFQRSEPLVRKLATLRASNREQFNELSSLLHDATVANVHPDVPLSDVKNAHLGKARVVGDAIFSKAQHPELAKRYNALSDDFKSAFHEVVKHYSDTQNKMSLGIINNQILKLMGIEDAALADRIHNGTLTDADRVQLGSNLDVIDKASELSKIEGPYVPLIRRGDHVVRADYKVTQPSNSKVISPNEFEFKTSKEAEDYAKNSTLKATLKKVWVDEKTGASHQTDPATGKEHKMLESDLDSVARYRVEVQNRHVEFVQGKRAAQARADELAKDSNLEVHQIAPRAYEAGGRQAVELSSSLHALVKKLEKSDAYKNATPTQQAQLRAAINEASLASHGSTRVSSRALPRRGVAGYSEDTVQGLVDYSASSSRYLAKLEHGSDLEAGLHEMQESLKADHSKTGLYARTLISNEVRKRVEGDNGFQQGGALAPIVKRALSASFTDKLGSPAYSVINAMQVGMVTMPYLSARHGVGRTFAALGKAYADINAAGIVKSGAKETARRIAGKRGPEDFMGRITKNLSADEKRMIEEHLAVGTIDPSAGMEIAEINKDYSGIGGKADAVLGYLEGVTREMPRAIESINRAVSAIAAYRLDISRGSTHEQAVQFSKDVVNNTQFNYSPTNSPGVFNHPLLKLALQFKKYGQGMYQMIGTQVGSAIRNEKPGDRKIAIRTLIGIAATHTAIAGALGLPTEPFKYLLMGAHALGLTGMTWADVEDKIRHQAAAVLGKTGGELATRGLPRLLNLDLSRAGLDSVTSFGEPRSQKESDVKTWLFDSLSGPVVSLGGDYIKGLNNITNGNFEKAAEQMIPLKAASDSLRAYRQYSEGKKSASGKQTSAPYSPTEAGLRALGFGSGREAEEGAANSAFYRQSQSQKDARGALINTWAEAKGDSSAKTKAWAAIQKWNQSQPAEAKIAPKELTEKAKRDAKASSSGVRGIVASKRDKRFLEEGQIYNVR